MFISRVSIFPKILNQAPNIYPIIFSVSSGVILVLIFQILIFLFIKAFLRLQLQFCQCPWTSYGGMINDTIKEFLIWRFTLVLIKINYGQIGDQRGLFYTTNPVFYTSGNRFVCRTGTFGNLWFFHLSYRTTVIQDLLVRRQFSLVPDNRTNVNVKACVINTCFPREFISWITYRIPWNQLTNWHHT